jgi:hypothetical protein
VQWAEFRDAFRTHYIPTGVMRKKRQEFMELKQGGMSMHNYSKQFNHLAQYAPDQVNIDDKKKDRFMIGLHHTTGALGAQHWRDIFRVHQQRHDHG